MDDKQVSSITESNVAKLLELLGVEGGVQVDIVESEDERKYVQVAIDAPQTEGTLIGHNGRMLDALSSLIAMMIPQTEQRYGVIVDVNGYRAERVKYIEDLTLKAIDEVVSTNQSVELQPMRPAERRIVHMTVADRTDIMTTSTGEDPNRRVIIMPTEPDLDLE